MENGRWFDVAVDGPLISNLKNFGRQAAIDGVGIAFAGEPLVAAFPGYYLCYPAQRQRAPPLRAVIDAIRSGARADDAVATIAAAERPLRGD